MSCSLVRYGAIQHLHFQVACRFSPSGHGGDNRTTPSEPPSKPTQTLKLSHHSRIRQPHLLWIPGVVRALQKSGLLDFLKQRIWDDIGETDAERDKMLLQLEQECRDVYRRKVDQASKFLMGLHQALADAEIEITSLVSALGDPPTGLEKPKGTLKLQMSIMMPILEDLRRRKEHRIKEFSEVQLEIIHICGEISGNVQLSNSVTSPQVDERDLTFKSLAELKAQLDELRKDKHVRLQKINGYMKLIHELSTVMSLDFLQIITEVHPSLGDSTSSQGKSISNETLAGLARSVHSLKLEKQQRLQKLQDLGSTLVELWNLMDIPAEEQKPFGYVPNLMSSSVDEMLGHGVLALESIDQIEVEVKRLDVLKGSRMKELILKKQNEIEKIYRNAHMEIDTASARQVLISVIDSGSVNLSELFDGMDDQIEKAKEQVSSRKEIIEKMDKWMFAIEEENWLDEYERDQNRFSAGRGAHKNLKRAEKARILLSKMPSMLEGLKSKVSAWEKEKGEQFLYDKVPLLKTLDEYFVIRQERDEEKRRSREQKRLQEQLTTEQEMLFGSKPTPLKPILVKKALGQNTGGNSASGTPVSRSGSAGSFRSSGKKGGEPISATYAALPKDECLTRNTTSSVSSP